MPQKLIDTLSRRFEIYYVIVESHITHYDDLIERFQVSSRTISRDLEFISNYIAPLQTSPGAAGGICLLQDGTSRGVLKLPDSNVAVLINLCRLVRDTTDENIQSEKDNVFHTVLMILSAYSRQSYVDLLREIIDV